MNRKEKKREAILQHGCNLKNAFSLFGSPVLLYKSLKRIENKVSRANEDFCNNESMTEEKFERINSNAMKALDEIFGKDVVQKTGMFINNDPRGYALKVSREWTENYLKNGGNIKCDWGKFGILAPDFDTEI